MAGEGIPLTKTMYAMAYVAKMATVPYKIGVNLSLSLVVLSYQFSIDD